MSTNEGKLENEEDLINEYGLKSEVDLKHKGDIKMTVTQVKGLTQKSLPAASTIHTPHDPDRPDPSRNSSKMQF